MTVQQKRFIELADIVSMRFECKNCHTSVQIAFEKFRNGTLYSCPNCQSEWAYMTNGMAVNNAEAAFVRFIDAAKAIEATCNNAPVGFTVTLEIKESLDPKVAE
jgi:DNA-directed RNA polymerase subunit RPC12/RpoP